MKAQVCTTHDKSQCSNVKNVLINPMLRFNFEQMNSFEIQSESKTPAVRRVNYRNSIISNELKIYQSYTHKPELEQCALFKNWLRGL